ncbi:hypothetical protein Hanom_Chr14g01250791 [Helianthus anomalus]
MVKRAYTCRARVHVYDTIFRFLSPSRSCKIFEFVLGSTRKHITFRRPKQWKFALEKKNL